MCSGDCQVDNQFDLWVGQQVLNGNGTRNIILCCLATRTLHIQVCAGKNVENAKGLWSLQIDTADVTTSDHANIYFWCCCHPLFPVHVSQFLPCNLYTFSSRSALDSPKDHRQTLYIVCTDGLR